jgi:hypothetical protein
MSAIENREPTRKFLLLSHCPRANVETIVKFHIVTVCISIKPFTMLCCPLNDFSNLWLSVQRKQEDKGASAPCYTGLLIVHIGLEDK